MSSKQLDLSCYRIGALAEALDQSESVIKLCLRGPRPNVEKGSIESITTIDEAKAMMRKARSRERKREIAKKWFSLCVNMDQLSGPFSDYGCPSLYLDDDLRHLRDSLALKFADEAVDSGSFGRIFECWTKSPHGFVEDRLLVALIKRIEIVYLGLYIIGSLEQGDQLRYESSDWTYWTVMQKLAELATPSQTKVILDIIIRHKRFDHENPTVAFLVRKLAEGYRY